MNAKIDALRAAISTANAVIRCSLEFALAGSGFPRLSMRPTCATAF